MPAQVFRHRFTVDKYCWMAETGTLSEDDRLELIEVEIVEMAPVGSRYTGDLAGEPPGRSC